MSAFKSEFDSIRRELDSGVFEDGFMLFDNADALYEYMHRRAKKIRNRVKDDPEFRSPILRGIETFREQDGLFAMIAIAGLSFLIGVGIHSLLSED